MNKLPAVTHIQQLPSEHLRLTLDIPTHLPVFAGHFSDHPVVPGVAQIDWAVHFAREKLGCTTRFRGMRNIKFSNIITPPAQVELELRWQAKKQCLEFRYSAPQSAPKPQTEPEQELTYSSGTLQFQS